MKAVANRTRLLLAVLAAVTVGGLVGGIVLARGNAEGASSDQAPGVLARGSFVTVDRGTAGTAEIVRDKSGRLKLHFSRSFRTQSAPELYVYLTTYDGARRTSRTEIGLLRRAQGSQEYDLPDVAANSLRASVEVLCAKCNSTFGVAKVEPTRTAQT